MSHYIGRYCGKHGEWDMDVDNVMEKCPDCEAEAEAMMEKRRTEFELMVRPIMEWLNKVGHPHMKIIIDCTCAEIVEGLNAFETIDYVPD